MDDLSTRQRNQLQRLMVKLNGSAEGFLFRLNPTLESILQWAEADDVFEQSPRHGSHVRVDTYWLAAINQALVSQGYAPLNHKLSGDRIEQAAHSVTEVKHVAESPTQHRLLRAIQPSLTPQSADPKEGHYWRIEDVDCRSIGLQNYINVVVVENLTVFYQLADMRIEWPPQALVVYRGDDRYQRACSRLLQRWALLNKPCYGLVDLDAFSVRMLQSGPYTHVAAPSLGRFQTMASAAHAPAKQQGFASNIEPRGAFAKHIEHMLQKQVGLKQEWMHAEPLYWFALD